MNKLIYSVFALSLMISLPAFAQEMEGFEFLGLESNLPVENPQTVSKELFDAEAEDWNVKDKHIDIDTEPLKGQTYSLLPWDTQEPEEFLSIERWLVDQAAKDKIPDWRVRIRDERHKELVGKVLQCHGECRIYRGSNFAKGQFQSQVREGDEIQTEKNSVAWIYLMDGTLLRVSSDTSVSFLEMNLSKKEAFFQIRLNSGHVYWHPRSMDELVLNEAPETDAVSLPLMIREANQEYFERKIFQSQKDAQRLFELMTLDDNAVKLQFDKINELKKKSGASSLKSKVMMVAPNSTIVSTGVSFDLVYTPGGKSYFKKRSSSPDEEFLLYLRGYNVTGSISISEMLWHEVEKDGRSYLALTDPLGAVQVLELITKRIKGLELAREIWFEKLTLPILQNLNDNKALAINFGYSLWGEESQKRFQYLVEYTRRLETTNLRSLENLLQRLESNGQKVERGLTDVHYQTSLNYYLKGLKQRYTDKKMEVREMSDLQYYVWILHHGKF